MTHSQTICRRYQLQTREFYFDDVLSEMATDQMQTLLIDARDILSSAVPSPAVSVQPTTLFFTTQLLTSAVPIIYLTPKKDRVRSVAPSVGVMTFTGPLNFLNTQSNFNHIFGLSPTMIRNIPRSRFQCASKNTEYFVSNVLAFCNLYRLHIFCNCIQL